MPAVPLPISDPLSPLPTVGGHTRILPRMPAGVTALAFVNGAPNLLMAASADGSVYLADINRPEDSHMSKTKLPHTCAEVREFQSCIIHDGLRHFATAASWCFSSA